MQRKSTDRHQPQNIQQQIYERVKQAILQGQLLPGNRIPPVRSLAADLGVARGTVVSAYRRLAGEGFVVASGPSGTRVAPHVDHRRAASPALQPPATPFYKRLQGTAPYPLLPGVPAMDAFPRKLWVRLVGRAARSASTAEMSYPDPQGLPALRRALAGYLRVSRGVACDPRQIFVTTGFQGSVDLVTRVALARGDRVWIEDPGYRPTRAVLRAGDLTLVPVPTDSDGLDVDAGIRTAPDAKGAFVSPAHQFPLGATLSPARRERLLAWAVAADAWVVEDDYDGEYHYDSHPLPALKSLDVHDRVFYCGTFSKVLYPALRIAYVVVPGHFVDAAEDHMQIFQHCPSPMMQQALADLIVEGHFARHLAKMRALYATRRDIMLRALRRTFGHHFTVDDASGGMHLILRGATRDDEIVKRAQAAGLGVLALSTYAIERPDERGILVGFTNVVDAEMADTLLGRLKDCIP